MTETVEQWMRVEDGQIGLGRQGRKSPEEVVGQIGGMRCETLVREREGGK